MPPVKLPTKFTPSSLSAYCRRVFSSAQDLRSRFGVEQTQAESFFNDFLPAISACRGHKEVRDLAHPPKQEDGLVNASFNHDTLMSWKLSCSPGSEIRHACHALTQVSKGATGGGIMTDPDHPHSGESGESHWQLEPKNIQGTIWKPDDSILHASMCGLLRGLEYSRQTRTSSSLEGVDPDGM